MSDLPRLDRLNVFRPFEGVSDHHEDRMTRAAMIVLKLVPQALEAFLGIARSKLVAIDGRLPDGELRGPALLGQAKVGTQQARLVDQRDPAGESEEVVPVLLSVFLTPDAHVTFEHQDVRERGEGQRLDGVVSFSELVIAIESKVEENAPSGQSEYLKLGDLNASQRPVVHIGWQELLGALLSLAESGLLGLAERTLVNDLFEFAEQQDRFDKLLPFQKLYFCKRGDGTPSDYRVKRRLRTILEDASDRTADQEYAHGWNILVPDGRTLSQSGLYRNQGQLVLAVWPGQRAHESRALLDDPEMLHRLATKPGDDSQPAWDIGLLPQIGYFRTYRDLSPEDRVGLETYAENADELRSFIGEMAPDRLEAELRPRLRELGLASEDDEEHLAWAQGADRANPFFRAGCWVTRLWPWEEAVALDDDANLAAAVRQALNELMEALGERARF